MTYQDCCCTTNPAEITFDRKFYLDQLGPRLLDIGNINKHISEKLIKRERRYTREERIDINLSDREIKTEIDTPKHSDATTSEMNELNDPNYT